MAAFLNTTAFSRRMLEISQKTPPVMTDPGQAKELGGKLRTMKSSYRDLRYDREEYNV
jgi:hypothetical protein